MNALKLPRRLVSLAPTIPTPTASSLVRIFRATPTVRRDAALPDQELSVFGSFTATTVFALDYPGLLVPLVLAVAGVGTGVAQRTSTFATLVVPDSVPMERLRVWPIDLTTAYAPVYVNRAMPTHADSDRFSPGYGGVMLGKNMLFTPGISKVYLKDTVTGQELTDSVINWSLSDDKYLFVNYSASATVGRSYYPGVSNGYGKVNGVEDVVYLTSTLTCIAGCPDYFDLAKHWISHRAIYYQGDKVFDVTTANATDDISSALQAAMNQAAAFTGRASGKPGAVVRIMSNCVLTNTNCPDHVLVTTGPNVQVTSPTGSDPTTTGEITPLLFPSATLAGVVGFNYKNLSDASTSKPYRNYVAYGGTDMLFANNTWDMGYGRWMESPGMRGATFAGNTLHEGTVENASPVRGGVVLDHSNYAIYRNNKLNFANDCVSMLGCTNSAANNNVYNWDYTAGNPHLGANHSLALGGGCRKVAVFNEVFNLLGTKDMNALKTTGSRAGQRANDGENLIVETTQNGSYYHCDFVSAATASTFTGPDLSNTVGAYVHLIAGNGKYQRRTIVSLSGNTATLDTPWDLVPDATTRYVTDYLAAEQLSVSNCTFFHGKRGILCYLATMEECDFTNNTFPNGSGIDCSPLASQGAQRPMWNVFIDGNTLDSSTDTANATRIGMHTVITDMVTPYGTLAANVTVRRNALTSSTPSLVVLIDAPFGSGIDVGAEYQAFATGKYAPSSTVPVQEGFIVANNSVRQCAYGVRTTQGVTGVYVRGLRTQGNTATHYDQLYETNTLGVLNYLETGTAAFTGAAVAGIGQVTS